jgi:deoxyribonuclease IV
MFGSHLSIAGGMHLAVDAATALQFDTVQVFTKNQQQWQVKPLAADAIEQWKLACTQAKFTQTVSHDSYLINLASPDESARARSIHLFVEEIRRCDALSIPFLVSHPGAHLGERDNEVDEQAGCERIAASLDAALAQFKKSKTVVCLESTAGMGTSLGHQLEHLQAIIERSKHADRLAVCLDTAHLFAAGYDFRGKHYKSFCKQLDQTIGLERVKVWHLNDSKKPQRSRVDRHEHIGLGCIGDDGFAPIVRDKRWKNTPKILETAKEKNEQGQDWDAINLARLKQMMR